MEESVQGSLNHNFCLHDVAWIHRAWLWTKRGDVGTTSPTTPARQKPRPKQSKHRFASLQHHPLIIAQAWKSGSCPPPGSGQSQQSFSQHAAQLAASGAGNKLEARKKAGGEKR
jgi:hypothetical protein